MIVRILTEGQFNLPGAYVDELNEIDNKLVEVVGNDDAEQFPKVLKSMLDLVRENGTPCRWTSLSSPTSSSPSRTSPSARPRRYSPARACSPTRHAGPHLQDCLRRAFERCV